MCTGADSESQEGEGEKWARGGGGRVDGWTGGVDDDDEEGGREKKGRRVEKVKEREERTAAFCPCGAVQATVFTGL